MKRPEYWAEACLDLSRRDPVLAQVISKYQGETLISKSSAFETLLRSLVGQQISVKAAESVWKRLIEKIEKAQPENILCFDISELRSCGLSERKAEYAIELASEFIQGKLSDALLTSLSDLEAKMRLCELRGVGPWTAEMFLIFHSLRPNIFPRKDLGLQKAIAQLFSVEYPMKDSALDRFESKWKPWNTVATWYLWRSLDPIPVEY